MVLGWQPGKPTSERAGRLKPRPVSGCGSGLHSPSPLLSAPLALRLAEAGSAKRLQLPGFHHGWVRLLGHGPSTIQHIWSDLCNMMVLQPLKLAMEEASPAVVQNASQPQKLPCKSIKATYLVVANFERHPATFCGPGPTLWGFPMPVRLPGGIAL